MLIVYSFTSCSEILSVPDISHERVELLSPSDEATEEELPITLDNVSNLLKFQYQVTKQLKKNFPLLWIMFQTC